MRRCTARRKPAATASRSSAPQDRRTRVLDVAQSAQRHRHVELAADDLQHARHAFLSHRAQAIEKGATDQGAARAERERLEHVLARADAAVEQHLDAAAHRADYFRQRADRRCSAVELAAAMVGDDDRVGAARSGDLRVLGVEDAFQDQLAAHRFFTHSTSFQLSVGWNWPAIHCESVVRLLAFGMRPSRLPNDLRFPLRTFNAQDGFFSTSRKVPRVRRGGTARPFFRSWWRWPWTCRSRVSTSAEHFAALARSMSEAAKQRSRIT